MVVFSWEKFFVLISLLLSPGELTDRGRGVLIPYCIIHASDTTRFIVGFGSLVEAYTTCNGPDGFKQISIPKGL